MVDEARARKLADRIKVIVAKKLERGIKDPRLGFVTITDVRVTGDLQHASIFYTVYGTDEERADSAAALKSATGMLRTEVGKNITSRLTPSLEFIADGIPENAKLIDSLLTEARNRDAEVESLARTGTYAGDADPYVKPRVIVDDDDDDDDDDGDGDGDGLGEDDDLADGDRLRGGGDLHSGDDLDRSDDLHSGDGLDSGDDLDGAASHA